MIECDLVYDLLPGLDQKAYGAFAKNTVETMLKQPGLTEYRANRNVLGSPQVRVSTMWKSLADWAKFTEGEVWRSLDVEVRQFATNVRLEVWGPSPLVPEPLRPAR